MAFIEWREEFATGIESMDTQHKKLVDLINALHTAMTERRGNEVMMPVLERLVLYTTVHFDAEEALMQKHGFPHFAPHRQEHEKLKAQVVDFQNQVKAGKTHISVQVLQFLREWLLNHIQNTDKEYGQFIAEHG